MPILPRIPAVASSPAGNDATWSLSRGALVRAPLLAALLLAGCRSIPPVPQAPAPVDSAIAFIPPVLPTPSILQSDSGWYMTRSLTTTHESQAQIADSAQYEERIHVLLRSTAPSRWMLTLQSDSGHRQAPSRQDSRDSLRVSITDSIPLSARAMFDEQDSASIVIEPSENCVSPQSLLSPLIALLFSRHLTGAAGNAPETLHYTTCYPGSLVTTRVQLPRTNDSPPANGVVYHRITILLSADSTKFLPMELSGTMVGATQSFGRDHQLPDSLKISAIGELFFRNSLREQRIHQTVETTFHRYVSRS